MGLDGEHHKLTWRIEPGHQALHMLCNLPTKHAATPGAMKLALVRGYQGESLIGWG